MQKAGPRLSSPTFNFFLSSIFEFFAKSHRLVHKIQISGREKETETPQTFSRNKCKKKTTKIKMEEENMIPTLFSELRSDFFKEKNIEKAARGY